MKISRRNFIKQSMILAATAQSGIVSAGESTKPSKPAYKRIATEEAFSTPEISKAIHDYMSTHGQNEPGFLALSKTFANQTMGKLNRPLQDLGQGRIREMDRLGISKQVLSITIPGVQIFDAAQAKELAVSTNNHLAAAVRQYPERFAGLAVVAPQDPASAASELERGVTKLGLKGAIINSHTKGEYLDLKKYHPILEAAQALDVPIYIHPREPSNDMIKPYVDHGLTGAMWGFAVETSLHSLRLIFSGVFDDFPNLKIVIGHMGEGIPFFLHRIDRRYRIERQKFSLPGMRKLKKMPSDYFRENFFITTSGMNWQPELILAHKILGADRIMYAMDYPYENTVEDVTSIDTAPIPESDKKKIFQLNAERLFKLS